MGSLRGNTEAARTVRNPRGQAGGIRGVPETPGWGVGRMLVEVQVRGNREGAETEENTESWRGARERHRDENGGEAEARESGERNTGRREEEQGEKIWEEVGRRSPGRAGSGYHRMGRARGCGARRVKGGCKMGRAGPLSPPLGPPVLEPGLDLRVRHFEGLGERRPLGRGQVLLAVEALFQLADLHPRKGRARLLTLGRRPVLIGVADAPGHSEGRERRRRCGDTQGPLKPSPARLLFRPHADPVRERVGWGTAWGPGAR